MSITGAYQDLRDIYTPCVSKWPWRRGPVAEKTSTLPIYRSIHQHIANMQESDNDTASLSFPGAEHASQSKTVFYLAYGSNLCKQTFLGKRGIRPLSATNVVVPSLRLTFDLPGIPYAEPCFANSGRRKEDDQIVESIDRPRLADEKTPLLMQDIQGPQEQRDPDYYHKNRWHKGLVGVVYELTAKDYAHVIATEGAGASYQDISVPCYPLLDNTDEVPLHPTTPILLAHTLFAPTQDDEPGNGGRNRRPDPSYAQASARYMKLLTDGAAEHSLPKEYADYLAQIRPYRITSVKQQLGRFIFMSIWLPIVMTLFMMTRMFANKKGKSPPWLVKLSAAIFEGVWKSYDGFFVDLFGDGERSVPDGGRKAGAGATVAAWKGLHHDTRKSGEHRQQDEKRSVNNVA